MSEVKQIILAKAYDAKNRQVSQGFNTYSKTHPMQAFYAAKVGLDSKVFLHAEIAALIKAKRQVITVSVERYGTTGNMLLARPCPICWLALKEAGVKSVIYTTKQGWIKEIIQ